ncbi:MULTISPECIES: ABC transporter substrate-binding protein [unclassified Bradyrhizobium]|uniref:ABC transporter substrate-binding protein n=1 Tax=unclassified Bradyrhizobium TaxID=2631580 RepID=UPI001BA736A9|nr:MULTISPECIES: ABC transporter substrate-binding protein [unclassified Bradyrhizobium]MBR1208300.1 ABC transporter substrate-binding protein [Bradyrhizobium sp. AUGA SZCCT0124]MBR1316567.1 ABC transporter substrate-binding protein [Bradyrhizobium sp. AUGA SZCCT0051]MBR1344735.1 ABC transporter substrate-binding protein [Bradyrhizobium sp. AUGA SZCCT0105]MBR1359588.1 ABC transporter substrate-binding protein [Bradyrhizobium sp. AUGA SZCCT0045]
MLRKLCVIAAAAALAAAPLPSLAQGKKDSVVMGMTLEPPGLDPTNAAAAAIAEVTLYNVYETLTKINEDGSVSPLLAESWQASPDLKTYTFKLRKGVKFHNGEPFDSAAVKFTFDRAAAPTSTNKDRSLYQAFASVTAPDPETIVVALKYSEPNLPFLLGQASGSIVEPKSAPTDATQPVGTGPYTLGSWAKGSSITLVRWPDYRNAAAIKLAKVTIRFIGDPAAQVASLLSGDVDAFPRVAAARSLAQFKADPRFNVLIGGSRTKTIVGINERKKPLDDVRVRRAILAAIDRKAMIDGAVDGFGTPIGSFYAPGSLGYVDTTGINPYDPELAKKLLAEAGVKTPLELSLKLPPPSYARQGGEVLAAQLAKIGIIAKIENVEWAQWLSQVFTGPHNYDLTMVAHVEPFDLVKLTEPDYYLGYKSEAFNALYQQIMATPDEAGRAKLLGDAQRLLATDAVAGFLFQPQLITIASKKLKGVWKDVPQFENDFSTWAWE